MDVFAYGERLNSEPISNLYKDKELYEKSSDTVSEESTLLLANIPQNINYNENTGSVIVHSNEAAAFDKSNVHLVTKKKNKKRSENVQKGKKKLRTHQACKQVILYNAN